MYGSESRLWRIYGDWLKLPQRVRTLLTASSHFLLHFLYLYARIFVYMPKVSWESIVGFERGLVRSKWDVEAL